MTLILKLKMHNNFNRISQMTTIFCTTSKRYSSKINPSCGCPISAEKVQNCLKERKNDALREEIEHCQSSKKYQQNWETYKVETVEKIDITSCTAFKVIHRSLPVALLKKSNVKAVKAKSPFFGFHLSAFALRSGEVTLAGEGGRHVGRKEYWEPILIHLQKHKHLSVCILSIGGGLGFDALAIAKVLKNDGFNVQKPTVIDPNPLAAFLSEDEVDYYVATSQQFFENYFSRRGGSLYIIHLGTTLNVITEEEVVQILRQVSQMMTHTDALSLIMVDKQQFSHGRHLAIGTENEQGISRVVYKKTDHHYKTIITNSDKFVQFMKGLGLHGELVDIVERGKVLNVAFVAYKAIKKV